MAAARASCPWAGVYRKSPDGARRPEGRSYHQSMGLWVVLVHELSDAGGGGWHYDWMIQPDGGPETPLISFRVTARPDEPGIQSFQAERTGNHRAAYLEFEGELTGNRGRVRRVVHGNASIARDDEHFVVTLDQSKTWIGRRLSFESPWYQFHLSESPAGGHTGHKVTVGETHGQVGLP